MRDGRLRELERRWRASGAFEDEVAWLSERVRTGELSWERLQIAALLGRSAASAVWLQARYLGGREDTELIGTPAGRIDEWRERGLPCHRKGLRVFYDPTQPLLDFLESSKDRDPVLALRPHALRPLALLGDLIEVRDYGAGLRALLTALETVESMTTDHWWDLASRLRVARVQFELPPSERDRRALAEARDGLMWGWEHAERSFANSLRIFVDGIRHGPSRKPKLGSALEGLTPCSCEERIFAALRGNLIPWALGTVVP